MGPSALWQTNMESVMLFWIEHIAGTDQCLSFAREGSKKSEVVGIRRLDEDTHAE